MLVRGQLLDRPCLRSKCRDPQLNQQIQLLQLIGEMLEGIGVGRRCLVGLCVLLDHHAVISKKKVFLNRCEISTLIS